MATASQPSLPIMYTVLYPDNEPEARHLRQLVDSLHQLRLDALKEKARPESAQKSAMMLDMLVVNAAFQRRGAVSKLTQWGLDETERRGEIEAVMEASKMGRLVYKQMGFHEMEDVEYDVDEEFKERDRP